MRAEKELLLEEIKEKINGSQGFLIARYQKLNSRRAKELRDVMESAGGEFEAVKKRVFAKALLRSQFKLNAEEYEGHIGIFFAKEDVLALSKIALKFGEDNEKAIELIGGVVDGELVSSGDIVSMARLPGIQELRAQFLAILQAPMQETLNVIDAFLAAIPYGIDERCKKLGVEQQ